LRLTSEEQVPETAVEKFLAVNWLLVILLCVLAAIGAAALYSVAGGSLKPWAEVHVTRFVIALGALIVIALVPIRVWYALAYPAYFLALGLLMAVPLAGSDALGAKRWLALGAFSFQPSEVMKVALVVMLARYYHGIGEARVSRPLLVLLPLVAIGLPAALTAMQPDLGTAVVLTLLGLGLMWGAGVHFLYFAALAGASAAALPVIWNSLHDYQRDRITVFLDPGRDPLGAGYHITQSKIALGSGGVGGKGFLNGTQSQLGFLPEKHTDFIFTNFAEEWGFAGSITVLALYGLILALLTVMAMRCRTQFARLLVAGASLTLFLYAAANVAMVSGLIPVVGIPLPFVSYGGTAIITLTAGLGLAMCAYVNRNLATLNP
jgi:rod shape determining protein RodA